MLRHIYFNLTYVKGRVSTWIMLALLTIMCSAIYILFPGIFNWETTVDVTISTSFLLIALLFVGVTKALNIFKDSETNGMELIIVSKPITRSMVISSKFLSLVIVLLFYTLSQLPIVLIGTIMHESSFFITYFNFFFLCFFITIFFAAVTTLLALVFGTLGSLAFSSLIGTLLILFTFLLPTLLKIGSIDKDSRISSPNYFVDNKYTGEGFGLPSRIVYNFDKDSKNYNYIWQPKEVSAVEKDGLQEAVRTTIESQDNIKFYLGDLLNLGRSFNSLITLFSNKEYKESYPIEYATKYLKFDNFSEINDYSDHLKYVSIRKDGYEKDINDFSMQLHLLPPHFAKENGGFFTKSKKYGKYVADASKKLFKDNDISKDFYDSAFSKLVSYKESIKKLYDQEQDKENKVYILTKFNFVSFLDYYLSNRKINERMIAEEGTKLFIVLSEISNDAINSNSISKSPSFFQFSESEENSISIIDNSWMKSKQLYDPKLQTLPVKFKKNSMFNSVPVSLDNLNWSEKLKDMKFWFSYSFSIDSLIHLYDNKDISSLTNYLSFISKDRIVDTKSDLLSYEFLGEINSLFGPKGSVVNLDIIERIQQQNKVNPKILDVFHSGVSLSISNKSTLKNLSNKYDVYRYELNEYINSRYSVIIVLLINILTFGASIIIYYRRDFK